MYVLHLVAAVKGCSEDPKILTRLGCFMIHFHKVIKCANVRQIVECFVKWHNLHVRFFFHSFSITIIDFLSCRQPVYKCLI